MYLLKLFSVSFLCILRRNSHSTMYLLKLYSCVIFDSSSTYSHSTMYLLKRTAEWSFLPVLYYSHSTMYLLKLICWGYVDTLINSHSTMYLLKPSVSCTSSSSTSKFTFHHVSIKTFKRFSISLVKKSFTFHHVSIKTEMGSTTDTNKRYSHSTMYLLKLCRTDFETEVN